MPYAVLAAALVALDQLVKYLVSHNIPLGGHVPFLPHLVELTYFQNTGAAFSMLEEHTWLLTLISAVMSVVLGVAVWKKFFAHPFGRCALTLVLAGAVGNLIDRALQGYVVDMFNVLLWTSPSSMWPISAWWWAGSPPASITSFSMRSWKERGPSMSTLTRTADRPGERADALPGPGGA